MQVNVQRRFKEEWQAFLRSPPGRRLQDRYHRRQLQKPGAAGRLLSIAIGIAMLAAGFVMLFVPGPGILAILFGAGLIAEQSHFAARTLDRMELKARQVAQWFKRIWQQPT